MLALRPSLAAAQGATAQGMPPTQMQVEVLEHPTAKEGIEMKRILALILIMTTSAVAKDKVQTSYDRFKDSTTIFVRNMLVLERLGYPAEQTIRMSFVAEYAGQKVSRPENVMVLVHFEGPDWKYLNSTHELLAIVDGKRISLCQMLRFNSSVNDNGYYVGVQEDMACNISFQVFSSLAGAKKVEFSLAADEFKLKDKQISAIQEMLRQLSA